MGCGITARGPQTPLYFNDFNPPIHELISLPIQFPSAFPQSGVIKNETGTFFDDREHIKQCQIVHINEIVLTTGDYLTGLEIQYYLDGGIKVIKHQASTTGKKFVLTLQNSDSIISCELTHDVHKIRSVKMETLEGKTLDWVSPLGPAEDKTSINLIQQRRALVAFRGKISDCIEGLGIYSWKLCGKFKN
jgi:hypothetical protein